MNSQGVKTINLWLILAKQANQKSYFKVKFITLHYFSYIHVFNKQLLDEVFVISRIIKVEVMVISPSRRLRLITLTETSHVFASSLMASNTKHANLTWLPLEVMYRGHTWHDYPWPWVSLTYNTISAVMTSWALILKIHCTLSANQERVQEFNV